MSEHKMTRNKRTAQGVFIFAITALLFYFIFSIGYSLGQKGVRINFDGGAIISKESGQPANLDFSLFWEAWNKLEEKSVQQVDAKKMVQGAISGMLQSLGDPYTTYFTPEENKRFREDIHGEFSGIGIEIVQKQGVPTVVAPLSGSPAEEAGLKSGDIIFEVDGTDTSKISFDETIDKIRGPENTKVKIKVIREGASDPLTFEITRKKITIKSVEWEYKNTDGKKIAVVKLRQFGDDTDRLFEDLSKDLKTKKPDGIVLDLRNNPGGYLETAVRVASYFIEDGIVVSEKGKTNKDYKATGGAGLKDFKTIVLVNNGSASASEILAGALKDRKGSKIIGEKTFGKGSVQELVDLNDGSALKVTVAKWFTPNGTQINGEGIKPDIEIKEDEKTSEDEQLQGAISNLVSNR